MRVISTSDSGQASDGLFASIFDRIFFGALCLSLATDLR
jgi:hypothetical protein